FTLLEVLVATVILGVAVVGLLSAISTSMRNAARLTDYDRVALVARAKMDALLVDRTIPQFSVVEGGFDPAAMGGAEAGWRARVTPFEMPVNRGAGTAVLERIELEVWWIAGVKRRTFTLDAFRRRQLRQGDLEALKNYKP
ncbi:MAG TPA: prepilin-type N-terminal cleavage/methylation domain-containing protein, partial [Bryobacterales bacterium]|nr:prepilin-type N-terminal cleavage/methylation domain-containing protein [Bryobacterales bacterium]